MNIWEVRLGDFSLGEIVSQKLREYICLPRNNSAHPNPRTNIIRYTNFSDAQEFFRNSLPEGCRKDLKFLSV